MNKTTTEKKKQLNKFSKSVVHGKRKRIVLAVCIAVLVFALIGFAWYYYISHREVLTNDEKVMQPYNLYLLDAGGNDYLNLTVGSLHPGETKQVVIGVSNHDPKGGGTDYKIAKESKFNYEMELAYTKNLPITYKVYELDKLDEASVDPDNLAADVIRVQEKNNSGVMDTIGYWKKRLYLDAAKPLNADTSLTDKMNKQMYAGEGGTIPDTVKNLGQYDLYSVGTDGTTKLQLNTTLSGNQVHFDLNYFLIEIDWKDGISFEDYKKETDLVYVIVKALQLKPEEQE